MDMIGVDCAGRVVCGGVRDIFAGHAVYLFVLNKQKYAELGRKGEKIAYRVQMQVSANRHVAAWYYVISNNAIPTIREQCILCLTQMKRLCNLLYDMH